MIHWLIESPQYLLLIIAWLVEGCGQRWTERQGQNIVCSPKIPRRSKGCVVGGDIAGYSQKSRFKEANWSESSSRGFSWGWRDPRGLKLKAVCAPSPLWALTWAWQTQAAGESPQPCVVSSPNAGSVCHMGIFYQLHFLIQFCRKDLLTGTSNIPRVSGKWWWEKY